MHLDSIRLGFANNSSSTHSILMGSSFTKEVHSYSEDDYGWDKFNLLSPESKADYLASIVASNISIGSKSTIKQVFKHVFSPFMEEDDLYNASGKVDHQSIFYLPIKHNDKLHKEFTIDFLKWLIYNPEISILGGNDNGDDDLGTYKLNISEIIQNNLLVKKDGDYYILFNRVNGTKLRLNFVHDKPYLSSKTPELVDVKITNYCPFGCPFCYMDSTKDGQHAPLNLIKEFIDKCADASVFEIAFGGGEPTLHPDFADILYYTRNKNIQPNFTSFNFDFLKNPKILEAVKITKASFAVSKIDPTIINQDLSDLLETVNIRPPYDNTARSHIQFQIPLGGYPLPKILTFIETLIKNKYGFTLLGYKNFGRGLKRAPFEYKTILSELSPIFTKYNMEKAFGADTLFVEEFKDELLQNGIIPQLMVSKEGAFSCYADLTTNIIAPSSYTNDIKPLDISNPFKYFPYDEV